MREILEKKCKKVKQVKIPEQRRLEQVNVCWHGIALWTKVMQNILRGFLT